MYISEIYQGQILIYFKNFPLNLLQQDIETSGNKGYVIDKDLKIAKNIGVNGNVELLEITPYNILGSYRNGQCLPASFN